MKNHLETLSLECAFKNCWALAPNSVKFIILDLHFSVLTQFSLAHCVSNVYVCAEFSKQDETKVNLVFDHKLTLAVFFVGLSSCSSAIPQFIIRLEMSSFFSNWKNFPFMN